MKPKDYSIQSFPLSRLFTMDVGKLGLKKHHIKAIIELDVTDSRIKLKSRKQEPGTGMSFTAWILKCIGQALSVHKTVHSIRTGRRKQVLFDHVDISITVEKRVDGMLVPIPVVIRNTELKSTEEIFTEIEAAKKTEIKNSSDYVLEQNRKIKEPAWLFGMLPQWVRLFIWKIILSNPHRVKKMMGTAVFTFVGMVGNVQGWFVPFSIHPVCFALGSVVKKPGVVKNKIEVREFLEMTVLIDHDVCDGAPAARFISSLKKLIEGGFSL